MTKLMLLVRGAALLLCLLISQATSTSHGQASVSGACIRSERDALLSFKASLLDPAGHLSSWQGEDCCQWKGVRCSNRTGHLIKLNLRNVDMVHYMDDYMYGYSYIYMYDYSYPNRSRSLSLSAGEMSSSLATLQHLRYLDLSWNDFNGTSIPVFLASLKNLRYLNLSMAGFRGRIPSQLGNLSKLQYLDLSMDHYDGNMSYVVDLAWLPRLSLLSHLDMSGVDLSSARDWFQMVNMLPSLKVLYLQFCGVNSILSGSIPHSNLTGLEVLDMSVNNFHTSLKHAWFWNLTDLKELHLSYSGLEGSIPSDLAYMTSLQVIDFSANDLVGLIPNKLENLCNLTRMRFDGNKIGSSIGEFMGRLPKCSWNTLQELSVQDGNMTGNLPLWIGNMTNLSVLEASENMLTGPLPVGVGALSNLKRIDLRDNNFNGMLLKEHFASLGKLEALDLSYNNFSGVLSEVQFASLGKLKGLDVSHNNFSGVLLKEQFASLGNLMSLDLSYNNFSGVLLKEQFASLGNLMSLDLSYNNFSGVLLKEQFASLGNLMSLDLSYNNFSGVLVKEQFASSGNLVYLDLSYNNFSGVLVKEQFASSGNLVYLDLSYNNFTDFRLKEHSTSLGNLYHLDVSHNKLNSVLEEEHFAGLLNLEYLDLSYNSLRLAINKKWFPPFRLNVARFRSCLLGPSFPEWLKYQSNVDVLVLSNANLDDIIPDWFWITFSRTSVLKASGNKLHGSLPARLPINIVRLNLSSNSLSGPLPSGLNAPLLEELLLANNHFIGTIPLSICQLTKLKRLDLSGNHLTGDIMQCQNEPGPNSTNKFGSDMLSLALNNNDLTGEFPKFLQRSLGLMFLDLSYNRFVGGLPEWLPEKMPHLKILRVRSNMFSGHIPKSLTSFHGLHYLDIAHNNITGSIPWSLSNLKAMMTVVSQDTGDYIYEESIPVITKDQKRDYTFAIYQLLVVLDLSSNSLAGHVPEEITSLIGLTNLNLSKNELTGAIPNQIGDLRQLDSLDLSFNEFSGSIPSSLSALTYLSHLNLSYNNLSGAIPSGQQLQTLDNQMYIYIGNPGLCGDPVGRNCSTHDAEQSDLEDIDHMPSVYLAMSIGFVVGLWTVFCTMLMKRTWRAVFFQFVDMMYDMVYVQVAVRHFSLNSTMRTEGVFASEVEKLKAGQFKASG
ncbi:LRR receptor-like serine/threonine-protein kinase GSO1 [Hordeum vulgare]|nr:LRR receptor-like serine/threonine-protein kinase GSO1 [Hordeum vulgare]